MNHSNRIPTATVDQDEASLVRAQMVVFGGGNWLSREAFQELATPTAPRGVEFFKLPVRTTIALQGPRAGLLSTVSRNAAPDQDGARASLARRSRPWAPRTPFVPRRARLVRRDAARRDGEEMDSDTCLASRAAHERCASWGMGRWLARRDSFGSLQPELGQEDVRISTGAALLNPSDCLLVSNESCGAGTRHRLNVPDTYRHGHV